jgi:hypothetical protein
MASKSDGLAEILVQLAANSATLIERARANGIFKQAQTVDVTPTPGAPAAAAAPDDFAQQKSALQEIIVQQAMKIHTLEAEIARLSKAS